MTRRRIARPAVYDPWDIDGFERSRARIHVTRDGKQTFCGRDIVRGRTVVMTLADYRRSGIATSKFCSACVSRARWEKGRTP